MKTKVSLAMVCITALLITALILGYNSWLLYTSILAIAGLGGFTIGKVNKS